MRGVGHAVCMDSMQWNSRLGACNRYDEVKCKQLPALEAMSLISNQYPNKMHAGTRIHSRASYDRIPPARAGLRRAESTPARRSRGICWQLPPYTQPRGPANVAVT